MKKRGTGWIPDYPDINDYTLDSSTVQDLSKKIQNQGTTGSIENLAQKVYEALDFFVNKYNQDNQKLTILRDDLEKEILGDLRFVTVKLHSVFREGMADSEVLLIKNYLQRIISTWRQFQNVNYEPTITDTTFDSQTGEAVIQILNTQPFLQDDGLVGKDDMQALELLASGVSLDRTINQFFKLIERNADIYTEIYSKNKLQKLNLSANDCQGILTVYLFPILKNIRNLNEIALCLQTKIEEKIKEYIQYQQPEQRKKYLSYALPKLSQKQQKEIEKYLNETLQERAAEINNCIQKLRDAIKSIEKDQLFILNIIVQFIEKLTDTGFTINELRDLTDVTNAQGLKEKIIDPISSLLTVCENLKDDFLNISKQQEGQSKLAQSLIQIQRLTGLLYMACPPEIPENPFFEKQEIPISSPIPEAVVKLFINKFAERPSSQSEQRQLDLEDNASRQEQERLKYLKENPLTQQILKLLNEILVQILMPLGQYNNLSEAVERGIEKIRNLFDNKKDNREEIRSLIRETMEEYNLGITKDYSLINDLDFQDQISKVLQKFPEDRENKYFQIKTEAESLKIQSFSTGVPESNAIEQGILSPITKQIKEGSFLIEKIQKFVQQEYGATNSQTKKPLKKPLFEYLYSGQNQPIPEDESKPEQTISGNTSSKTTENSFQQMRNSLQFPISSRLRKEIDEKREGDNKSVFLSLPEFVDLTYWCSPIEDQGSLNSCTAHAGIALMEYAQKKSSGSYTDASPLFLYQVTRNLMQREGDSGASVRDTIKAMVAFGVCPEEYWNYDEDKFDQEPTPFCYSFADNYKTIKYFRLDYGQISKYTLLSQVKVLLVSEIPCIFGFTLYNSVYDEANVLRGYIPLPSKRDKVIGGHTVVAVGYHDRKIIQNDDGKLSQGALLIRNSWGTRWGQGGYGWIPYDYITKGLTADWWSLLKAEWLATGRFGAGASAWNPDKGDKGGDVGSGQTGGGGSGQTGK